MSGGKYDLFTKAIFRENGKDVVTWLTGLTPLEVEPVCTELVIAEARQAAWSPYRIRSRAGLAQTASSTRSSYRRSMPAPAGPWPTRRQAGRCRSGP